MILCDTGPLVAAFNKADDDHERCARFLATAYASLRLQAVDACVVALAERFDVREVAALDHRDFMVVAPRHLPKGQKLVLRPD